MVEVATVVGLEVADDAGIARLNLRGHVRRQVKNGRVPKADVIRNLLHRSVPAEVIQDQEDLPTGNMEIKCPEPLQEDDLCHPHGRIVPVYAPK